MVLSDRQRDILSKAVFEYIDRAQPISSSWLEDRYDMQISPATIRNEFLYLCEEGYLEQPHISAGRVPTDKGYRFLVDEMLEQPSQLGEENEVLRQEMEQKVRDYVAHVQLISRELSEASSNLIIMYIPQKNFLWKDGWEQVLQAPEFEKKGHIGSFTKFLEDVERGIQRFHPTKLLEVYIGKENPFSKEEDFSIMLSAYPLSKRQSGVMALVGPKRMSYKKNIGLLSSLRKIFA